MIRLLRRTARRLIQRCEQWLHPIRRTRAYRTLTTTTPLDSILVVCLGNICRSPYAALRLRTEMAARGLRHIDVSSAGFIGPGRSSPPVAQQAARARGIDLAGHRSRVLAPGELTAHDLVVVMSSRQRRRLSRELGTGSATILVLGDLDPEAIRQRAIDDPFDGSDEVFRSVYERLDRCIEALAGVLATRPRAT